MLPYLRPALFLLIVLSIITGIAYPLTVTGIAQILAPHSASGSIVTLNGKPVGSVLVGQAWTNDRYFHGRPSAAGAGYDGLASSGSNLGPTSQKLMDRVKRDVDTLKASGLPVPADAVTASGSGLDPHISPAYARLQVQRVAKARSLDEAKVQAILDESVELPALGLFGEPRVNVLLLNRSLDRLSSTPNG